MSSSLPITHQVHRDTIAARPTTTAWVAAFETTRATVIAMETRTFATHSTAASIVRIIARAFSVINVSLDLLLDHLLDQNVLLGSHFLINTF